MSAVISSSSPAVDLAAVKTRQQAAWSTGNYAVVGTTIQIVGASAAERVPRSGDRAEVTGVETRETTMASI